MIDLETRHICVVIDALLTITATPDLMDGLTITRLLAEVDDVLGNEPHEDAFIRAYADYLTETLRLRVQVRHEAQTRHNAQKADE